MPEAEPNGYRAELQIGASSGVIREILSDAVREALDQAFATFNVVNA